MGSSIVSPPEQGQLVGIRSRQWIVSDVAKSALSARPLEPVNGYAQQAYYSIALGGCVNPTAWDGVYEYSQSAKTWTKIGGQFHQLYAGGYGLIGVDPTNFDVWRYSGTPNTWNKIGGPGSIGLSCSSARAVGSAAPEADVRTSPLMLNGAFTKSGTVKSY